jgi:hypothetical protein
VIRTVLVAGLLLAPAIPLRAQSVPVAGSPDCVTLGFCPAPDTRPHPSPILFLATGLLAAAVLVGGRSDTHGR